MKKNILITGGAGFIGSHVVRLFVNKYPEFNIINLDALTYAGNLENIKDIENASNYQFVKADILDKSALERIFRDFDVTDVIHLAAESHVDRSIVSPLDFVFTNVLGTVNLLNEAKEYWKDDILRTNSSDFEWETTRNHLFYHVSTDEVYGSLGKIGLFTEKTSYDPNSPYSASKASSDHFVRAYGETYQLPIVVSNCSNNYGPNHFPEKLIPLFINNIINKKPLPVYGDGLYTRDWLYVKDHAIAIDLVFNRGVRGNTYNIGGFNEWTNIELVKLLCKQMDEKLGRKNGESERLITYINDRAGHDRRYAIDASKINRELGWYPTVTFEQGLEETIEWYLNNNEWLTNVTNGIYQNYYEEMYNNRL
ncbi:dTDP-glucose 4,6-dehydratase [Aquirufa sp. HETE-83D]|uniref:dTDP-glucose 4,6-dehydratase n=1 Tax=Aquirufa esocilacus TaxID=3096513 RepID=A0ABW6DPE8_9BACT